MDDYDKFRIMVELLTELEKGDLDAQDTVKRILAQQTRITSKLPLRVKGPLILQIYKEESNFMQNTMTGTKRHLRYVSGIRIFQNWKTC